MRRANNGPLADNNVALKDVRASAVNKIARLHRKQRPDTSAMTIHPCFRNNRVGERRYGRTGFYPDCLIGLQPQRSVRTRAHITDDGQFGEFPMLAVTATIGFIILIGQRLRWALIVWTIIRRGTFCVPRYKVDSANSVAIDGSLIETWNLPVTTDFFSATQPQRIRNSHTNGLRSYGSVRDNRKLLFH
ncbi:hypothetical protein HMPREF1861_01041 [Corynebacterium kroppenstedtii]|nr:hypothetical protein HMPREF1861_01041 [Corynebacterium kroppenstedtii]